MTRLRPPQLVGLAAAIGLAVAGMLKWLDGDPGITGYNTGFGVWVAGIAGVILAAGGLLTRPVRSN